MNKYNFLIVMISAFLTVSVNDTYGQAWNFVKGKDGIKIYTRDVSGSSLKSFKGEVTFKADIEKVSLIVGNAKNIDWWDKDIIEKKDKIVQVKSRWNKMGLFDENNDIFSNEEDDNEDNDEEEHDPDEEDDWE